MILGPEWRQRMRAEIEDCDAVQRNRLSERDVDNLAARAIMVSIELAEIHALEQSQRVRQLEGWINRRDPITWAGLLKLWRDTKALRRARRADQRKLTREELEEE